MYECMSQIFLCDEFVCVYSHSASVCELVVTGSMSHSKRLQSGKLMYESMSVYECVMNV